MLITILACLGVGALHQYHDCATDTDVTVTVYLPQSGTGSAYLFTSDGGQWAGPYAGSGLPSVLTSQDGTQVVLTLAESSYRRSVNMGRLRTWQTVWSLAGGTVQE